MREDNEGEEPTEMPANPAWLLKIPQIIAMLESIDVPVVDRAMVERLFGLQRRQAIELLHRLGGYQAGEPFWWTAWC